MRKADAVRLRHMLDAVHEAISFAQGKKRADLDENRMLVLALIKDIEIVGEAACRISEAIRQQAAEIPWEEIIGMRHRLVHGYFDVNLDILWRTVQDDLPLLRDALEPLLSEVWFEDAELNTPEWHRDALRETEKRRALGLEKPIDWDVAKKELLKKSD